MGRMQRGLRKVSKILYRWLKTGANVSLCESFLNKIVVCIKYKATLTSNRPHSSLLA